MLQDRKDAYEWGKETANLTLPFEFESGLRASGDTPPEGLMQLLQQAQADAVQNEVGSVMSFFAEVTY